MYIIDFIVLIFRTTSRLALMTLDQIKYFLAAAEYQHVGKAARSIHISPSAVSAAISALEAELNATLFERRLKRIQLTPTGYKFKVWGQRLIKEVQTIRFQITNQSEDFQGRYRVGASHFLASELLGPAWFRLQDRHPNLIGDIRSLETGGLISEILGGRLDLGVVFSVVSHPEIEQTRILEGPLVIAVRKNHPVLRKPNSSRLKSLSDYPALTHRASQGAEVCEDHPIFSKIGVVPRTALYFDHDNLALLRIKESNAWVLIPEFIAKNKSGDVDIAYKFDESEASYFIAVVRHRSQAYDPLLAKLTEELKDQALSASEERQGT